MRPYQYDSSKDGIHPLVDPEKLAEAERKVDAIVERMRYLKERIQAGTATPEEDEEYDDITWWMDHPMPALPPPEGTPNPWELPRPPRKPRSGEA